MTIDSIAILDKNILIKVVNKYCGLDICVLFSLILFLSRSSEKQNIFEMKLATQNVNSSYTWLWFKLINSRKLKIDSLLFRVGNSYLLFKLKEKSAAFKNICYEAPHSR